MIRCHFQNGAEKDEVFLLGHGFPLSPSPLTHRGGGDAVAAPRGHSATREEVTGDAWRRIDAGELRPANNHGSDLGRGPEPPDTTGLACSLTTT